MKGSIFASKREQNDKSRAHLRDPSQLVFLDGSSLTIGHIFQISRKFAKVEIAETALNAVAEGRRSVERILRSGRTTYGINTGFGKLADSKIRNRDLDKLQLNLIRSHAVGTGDAIPEDDARAMMVVRLNSLLRGNSGVRKDVIRIIQEILNNRVQPFIPRYGSLGASGDLAPSAHLGLCMIGEGYVIGESGKKALARDVLNSKKIKPISLKAKEGLAIINGTQMMTAIGSLLVYDSLQLMLALDIAAAMTLEALGGSLEPFDSRVQSLRPMHGQAHVASRILKIVRDSKLVGRSKHVQDPYSLRCIPQVHGAFYDAIENVRRVIEIELNSVTDNPIIFPESDEAVSAGNFHGQPIALALDMLALVLAEASVISERRIDKLLSNYNSKLPFFLSKEPGLNSGLMVTQYTAASLVAENRILGSPAGLSGATVSAGQEDHASMGVTAALKAEKALRHTTNVVAIELICASQALDIVLSQKKGPRSSKLGQGTAVALKEIRKLSPGVSMDRSLHDDLEIVSKALFEGSISRKVEQALSL